MNEFSFPKDSRLRKSKQFHEITKLGEKKVGQLIVIHSMSTGSSPHSTLGITVSRKFGKSHMRNRFKRIVREAFRLGRFEFTKPLAIEVRPRELAKCASMQEIQAELITLLNSDLSLVSH